MTHLFINTNLLHNCWFYTRAAWFVKHDTWYQNWTKTKEHLLNHYGLNYACCELFTGRNIGFDMNFFHIYIYIYIYTKIPTHIHKHKYKYISKSVDVSNIHTHIHIYICISKSVNVYTRYVLTKHRNNMNIG